MEVEQFDTSTQQILQRTDSLLKNGTELETLPHTDQPTIHWLMGKIKQLMTDFDDRLAKRKKKLDESVRLHRLIETSLDWCIESASLLSEYDIITTNPGSIDPDVVKQEFDQFLLECPAPSQEDLQELLELMESTESIWSRDNAAFAHNRVLEIIERFCYYHKELEKLLAQRKEEEKKEAAIRKDFVKKTKRVVRAVDSLISRVSDVALQVGGDLDSSQDASTGTEDESFDETDASQHRPPHAPVKKPEKQGSLHYEDLDEALMLLESAAQSASNRLDSQRAAPPLIAIEGGDLVKLRVHNELSETHQEHRLSKQDISEPTETVGALFAEDGDMLDRRPSCPCEEDELKYSIPAADEDLMVQTKHAKHRRRLMEELIATEESYIRSMECVVEHYMPAMDDLGVLPRNLVGKKNVIFSNIQSLLEFNRHVVLPQLLQCRKCPIKLGRVFLAEEEEFLNYSSYFKNMPQQTALMEEGGIDFFRAVQQGLGDKFNLSSYLIKPFQRASQYKLFLQDLVKHSTKSDLKGKMKEYYDKLKEAYKMIDFILRHGNDLLAVECIKDFPESMAEQGKVLRQGDLIQVNRSKHRRRVFLFEHSIVFTKKKKLDKHKAEVAASEIFEYRNMYKTSDLGLRENVAGYPTRFELWRKRESIVLQADGDEQKAQWVQDIWDLFFSHMLQLKDQKLEEYGTRPLTSVMTSGSATLTRGRTFGHSMRRSLRFSNGSRVSREMISRPNSGTSASSRRGSTNFDELAAMVRPMRRTYSPTSPRVSGTFVDLRGDRMSSTSLSSLAETEASSSDSRRSSIISTSSIGTITSLSSNLPMQDSKRQSRLISDVYKAERNEGIPGEVVLVVPSTPSLDSSVDSTPTSSQDEPIFDTPV